MKKKIEERECFAYKNKIIVDKLGIHSKECEKKQNDTFYICYETLKISSFETTNKVKFDGIHIVNANNNIVRNI